MFKQLIDKAIYLKIVSSENREIYEYGITNLSYSLLVWSIFLLSAFLFGFFPSALFFLLTHIPLRIYAGGLHFSTRIRCFIASLFIFVVVLFFPLAFSSFKLCKAINPFIILGLIIILFFAPVEDPRKPLEISESLHHRKISRILGINYVILYFIFYLFSFFFMAHTLLEREFCWLLCSYLLGKSSL